MPRQNKIIVDSVAMFPHTWAKPLGLTHHRQGTVVAIAPTKKAVEAALAEHGLAEYETQSIVRGMRVWPHSADTQALLEAGALSMDEPRLLAYRRAADGGLVAQVLPDGRLEVIGHWEYDRKTYRCRFVKEA